MPKFDVHCKQTICTHGNGLFILVATNANADLKIKIKGETYGLDSMGNFHLTIPPTDQKIPIDIRGEVQQIFVQLKILSLDVTPVMSGDGLAHISDAKIKVKLERNRPDFFLSTAATGPQQHFGEPQLSGRLTVYNGEKRVIHTLIESKTFGFGLHPLTKKIAAAEQKAPQLHKVSDHCKPEGVKSVATKEPTDPDSFYDFSILLPTSEHPYKSIFKSPDFTLENENYIINLQPFSPFPLPLQPHPKSFKEV